MKIASLQYQYDFPKSFESYRQKVTQLVEGLSENGVELVLFPEYAGFEIASFSSLETLNEWIPAYLDLFQHLSLKHKMFICTGTQLVKTVNGTFNRSYFFSPNQKIGFQDKCVPTPFEREEGILTRGDVIRLFETPFGKVGICICYDIEFPPIVLKLIVAGAKLILVPSYTSTVHGYFRVNTSCRARALENQCFVVQSAMVGKTDIEMACGSAAICSPIDSGFPEDGLLAQGPRDIPYALIAELDFELLDKVRTKGQTRNFQDTLELASKKIFCESFDLQ